MLSWPCWSVCSARTGRWWSGVVGGDFSQTLLIQLHVVEDYRKTYYQSVPGRREFYYQCSVRPLIYSKVVKRLSVNRLPVKLPITAFNFQLPITDLPTFSASASSHRPHRPTKAGPRHTVAVGGSVPLVHVNPAFDCRVCSSPYPRRVTAAGKGGEGKRCELDGRRGLQRLRPIEFCSPLLLI